MLQGAHRRRSSDQTRSWSGGQGQGFSPMPGIWIPTYGDNRCSSAAKLAPKARPPGRRWDMRYVRRPIAAITSVAIWCIARTPAAFALRTDPSGVGAVASPPSSAVGTPSWKFALAMALVARLLVAGVGLVASLRNLRPSWWPWAMWHTWAGICWVLGLSRKWASSVLLGRRPSPFHPVLLRHGDERRTTSESKQLRISESKGVLL
jgi:hypothetical protein